MVKSPEKKFYTLLLKRIKECVEKKEIDRKKVIVIMANFRINKKLARDFLRNMTELGMIKQNHRNIIIK